MRVENYFSNSKMMTFDGRPMYYTLKHRKPIACLEYTKYMRWQYTMYGDHRRIRRVRQTTIGDYWVSTVFLGIDHAFEGKPKLFETMIFGKDGVTTDYCTRCSTWREALHMHWVAVNGIKEQGELFFLDTKSPQ